MTLSEFQHLLLEKGDRLSTWSESQQREARELLDASSEAVSLLAEAGRLREAILSQTEVKAPAGLKNRIFAAAFASSSERRPVLSIAARELRAAAKAAARA